jgi:hypothetical protein
VDPQLAIAAAFRDPCVVVLLKLSHRRAGARARRASSVACE